MQEQDLQLYMEKSWATAHRSIRSQKISLIGKFDRSRPKTDGFTKSRSLHTLLLQKGFNRRSDIRPETIETKILPPGNRFLYDAC